MITVIHSMFVSCKTTFVTKLMYRFKINQVLWADVLI